MTARWLVDTNVLVYAYDRSNPQKQVMALNVLDRLTQTGTGALSTQILAEFFTVVTRKVSAPLTLEQAYRSVQNYLMAWPILEITGLIVLEAIRGVRDHHFAYLDAQIWATAKLNQINLVLSEDFPTGSIVEGVHFMNPFSDDFHWE